ncbi:type II toxin-antitoxin system RelE/ParE family toxin [Galbibacter pacificus]|uniref:Type II toxin-antitoxin system RelE/ParE family toxin n=1 Tax=Galbibacter pacificus TaxID=2996052 RepID=A0ABT6FSG1_9FLAO|nr:type II toxin-antitoxin system RelE/ParE family toxin [Galbibacter pacificus]MDG3582840.1 type II toxin-antitoxin system RelE/ParE family toxin [Galbibacter pacificus]MDG3586041.1 type II toxin-antitoxin system RelE/ParE family toxin [Galbibacter pacificus]
MYQIVWSIHAQHTYLDIIEQIFSNWNIDIVERFENQTYEVIDTLRTQPFLGKTSDFEGLHKYVINTRVSLVYRVNSNTIELVTFIFNKSDHIF